MRAVVKSRSAPVFVAKSALVGPRGAPALLVNAKRIRTDKRRLSEIRKTLQDWLSAKTACALSIEIETGLS
jgi:hypothetical protein